MAMESIYEGYRSSLPRPVRQPVAPGVAPVPRYISPQNQGLPQGVHTGAPGMADVLRSLNPSGVATLGWPAQTPGAGAGTGGGGGGGSNWNYQLDPAIRALFMKNAANRKARRDSGKKDVLMKSGLWKIAKDLFGGDAAWVETVKNNPFSDMSNIANSYEGRLGRINVANEDLNKENLFFSSTRTNDVLPQIYRDRGNEEYSVETAVRDAIQRIEDEYMQAEFQDQMALRQAELEGAQYYAQNFWGSGGGGGGGGGGGSTDPRTIGIAGMPIFEGFDTVRGSDIQYSVPGRGLPAGAPGWQRDGAGWIAPNGTRLDENGRVR